MTKKKKYIRNLTDLRFWIALNRLKLPNMGRGDNIERIYNSDLSWQKKIEWAKRISEYTGKRTENIEYFTILYGSREKAEQRLFEKSNKMSGKNNPWYNHGGKFSPFKKGSVNYSTAAVEKASENRTYNTRLEYWIEKGYSLEEAKDVLKERQSTVRLDKFIDRYGENEGRKRWKERQEKWQNTLNNKTIEEIQKINAKKIPKIGPISKAEKEIFEILRSYEIEVNKQHHIKVNKSKYNYFYDIVFGNKIIEYNGDYWHCNPKNFKETDIVKRGNKIIPVKEIWEKENIKLETAKNNGYKVLVIWESDYRKNREETISKCINFLTQ